MKHVLAAVALGMGLTLSLHALPAGAKRTDQSDLWWIRAESGWGIHRRAGNDGFRDDVRIRPERPADVVHRSDGGAPGSLIGTGTLYATTGPWFGTVRFDPGAVSVTPVGTMSFDGTLIPSGTLTYSVNGVQVTKLIERQTLTTIDFGATYSVVFSQQGSGPPCAPAANTSATPATFEISQSGSAMTITVTSQAGTCTYAGAFSQAWHFGRVAGNYTCSAGDTGTFKFFEMAASWFDFRARTSWTSQSGCVPNGFANGLKQPPPPQ